jgi:tetratricopeptide (TPR) repeat protein
MADLKMDYDFESDDFMLATKALERGDAQACAAMLSYLPSDYSVYNVNQAITSYHELRCLADQRGSNDQNLRQAVKPLEQALAIEEQSYGLHSDALASTLTPLAYCYKSSGQDQKAIATYERLFSLSPKAGTQDLSGTHYVGSPPEENGYFNEDLLSYVDLLAKHGQTSKGLKLLEKAIFKNGVYNVNSPLFIRLLQAYVDTKDTHKAHYMASAALKPS